MKSPKPRGKTNHAEPGWIAHRGLMMKWRKMKTADVPIVTALANAIHTAYPEDEAVFAEKVCLYPDACHSLLINDVLVGYALAHPWLFGQAPALNSLLGALPLHPDTLYLHDVALIPEARGKGAVRTLLQLLIRHAKERGFPSLSLTAVNNSVEYWRGNGFILIGDAAHSQGLASYGKEAYAMALYLD